MSLSFNPTSQKEYLKKYLSGDVKKKRKKKAVKASSAIAIKRSQIIDDDFDLDAMRPLGNDELELYQMDEDAPQIAGIIDERPEEVKAKEYYNSKRWKVFGGDDGVNIVDSMDKNIPEKSIQNDVTVSKRNIIKEKLHNKSNSTDSDNSPIRNGKDRTDSSRRQNSQDRISNGKKYSKTENKEHSSYNEDSDLSPPRNDTKSKQMHRSDHSTSKRIQSNKYSQENRHSDDRPPRKSSNMKSTKHDQSPPRKEKKKAKYSSDSDNSPPRKQNQSRYDSDSDNSPPRMMKKTSYKHKSDSDNSPQRMKKRTERVDIQHGKYNDKSTKRIKKRSSSDSDNSPPRNKKKDYASQRNYSPSRVKRDRFSRSITPSNKHSSGSHISRKSNKNISPRLSRKDLMHEKNVKRHYSDSDDSPPRRKPFPDFHKNDSSSDLSPQRKKNDQKPKKKKLYIPNDSSSSDEKSRSKNKKMKVTLDGKQAGLQDAKQLKKELSELKMKEDLMFSKMDASVSGVGAAAIKRDRKTGQIRDLEKEKEFQKEKEAKASVVNEKYSKWGRGLKQVEDAKERAAEALKEMNKPLARYVDDEDLDNFLKAQEREGDPMLDYIKEKQKEATSLVGEKPTYKGSYNPNRFGIRPGHRWDGVVRSNGFEKEWFTHQNARKARDEEAYKWSTSDM